MKNLALKNMLAHVVWELLWVSTVVFRDIFGMSARIGNAGVILAAPRLRFIPKRHYMIL